MKTLFPIVVLLLSLFIGCSNQETSITSPIKSETELVSKAKLTYNVVNSINETALGVVSITKAVNGAVGRTLSLNERIINTEGRVIDVSAQLEIPAKAFTGTQSITMRIDTDSGYIYFYPHMNFDQKCTLSYYIKNINMTNLGFSPDNKKAYFVYFADDGSTEPVDNMKVDLVYEEGYLNVNKAKLNHFSRYGFMR